MKESTILKINHLVLSYFSISGLNKETGIVMNDVENPITTYFFRAIIQQVPYNIIPRKLFYGIIEESIRVYKQLDFIIDNQNPIVREFIKTKIDKNDFDYDEYIGLIVQQFKTSLYNLLKIYKTKNIKFNKMKLDIFVDKMWEYAEYEEYEKAAELKEKIKNIKELIK